MNGNDQFWDEHMRLYFVFVRVYSQHTLTPYTDLRDFKGYLQQKHRLHFVQFPNCQMHIFPGSIKLNGPCRINFASFRVHVVEKTFQRPEEKRSRPKILCHRTATNTSEISFPAKYF